MNKKRILITISTLISVLTLTSCNDVKLAIKSKGEQVSPLVFGDSFMQTYENNLKDFTDKWFSGYLNVDDLNTSFNINFKQETQRKVTAKSIVRGISKTTDIRIKGKSTHTYDNDGIYSISTSILKTTSDQNIVSYSSENDDIQYQTFDEGIICFDKNNETYYEIPGVNNIKRIAINDEYASFIYNTLANAYAQIALEGSSFGEGEDYKNNQYFCKGNVFTVVTTLNYSDLILDKTNYAKIQGTVEETRQYIIEKKAITYTKYIEYKKVSWQDADNEYVYTMTNKDGVTYELTMKGYCKKLSTQNFSEIEFPS